MDTCLYCNNRRALDELMIKIADLSASTVFLFKEQSYKGRCVVAYKEHNRELYELTPDELLAFMSDVNRVAAAIKRAFGPAKINYGAYSDKLPHLHFHLAPKYEDGPDFGGVFQMNPKAVYLSEAEYAARIDAIRKEIYG